LGDWATHGTSTGGYYQCNIYDKQAKEGKHAEEETSRQRAKHALDKYMFYFERFMEHDKSMHMTVKAKAEVDNKVQKLHDVHGFEIIELQFLYDALRQVRACRRVLKWTYVYGYYLDENSAEKNLFEHLQRNIEEKTDLLHGKLENDLDKIFEEGPNGIAPDAHQKWKTFRSDVTNFTNVTQKFREQILADITSTGSLSMETAAPSSAKPAGDSLRNSWSRWAHPGR
jgi:ariadne-1